MIHKPTADTMPVKARPIAVSQFESPISGLRRIAVWVYLHTAEGAASRCSSLAASDCLRLRSAPIRRHLHGAVSIRAVCPRSFKAQIDGPNQQAFDALQRTFWLFLFVAVLARAGSHHHKEPTHRPACFWATMDA